MDNPHLQAAKGCARRDAPTYPYRLSVPLSPEARAGLATLVRTLTESASSIASSLLSAAIQDTLEAVNRAPSRPDPEKAAARKWNDALRIIGHLRYAADLPEPLTSQEIAHALMLDPHYCLDLLEMLWEERRGVAPAGNGFRYSPESSA